MHIKSMRYAVNNGFTLAEILITLGIIGIVSAMTLPTLLYTQRKKETVTKLQKAIATINEAHRLSYSELGEPAFSHTTNLNSKEYFDTYWAPYIKISQYCETARDCGYSNYTPFTQANGQKSGWYVVEPRLRTTFITADGFLYTIFLATWKGEGGKDKVNNANILVDINGGKMPNKFGVDVFWLTRTEDNDSSIRTLGYTETEATINSDCSTSGIGYYCAEKILRDGWKITGLYPF